MPSFYHKTTGSSWWKITKKTAQFLACCNKWLCAVDITLPLHEMRHHDKMPKLVLAFLSVNNPINHIYEKKTYWILISQQHWCLLVLHSDITYWCLVNQNLVGNINSSIHTYFYFELWSSNWSKFYISYSKVPRTIPNPTNHDQSNRCTLPTQ